ncbi:MAG: hypothetical protein ACK2US_19140 [Anaerolineae bacterium]|jgi:hypothetical protein
MSEYQAAPPTSQGGKPGKVQAIAIMTLIDGILNALYGLVLAVSMGISAIGTFGITCLCVPAGIYAVVVGVLEIIAAIKLLPEPTTVKEFPKYLAIMQIVNVISLNVLSPVTGILALVFADDPEVVSYFASVPVEPPAESL